MNCTNLFSLAGNRGLILGIADDSSIARCSRAIRRRGAANIASALATLPPP